MVQMRTALLMALLVATTAARNVVLVDHSGSLENHYAKGKVGPLVQAATKAAGDHDLAGFGDAEPVIVDGLAGIECLPWYNWTHLDKAIAFAIDRGYDIAWIVTDNIHDEGAAGVNQERFYRQLAQDAVAAATIFPVVLDPADALPGLVVYVAALSPSAVSEYGKEQGAFLQGLAGAYKTQAFSIKPLDNNAIHPYYPGGPPKFRKFHPGDIVKGEASIAFRSDLPHIDIQSAQIVCNEEETRFITDDPVLVFEKAEYSVEPVTVEDLKSGGSIPGYTLRFDLGRLRLQSGLGAFVRAAFDVGTRSFRPRAGIRFRLEPGGATFTGPFLADYSARDPGEARMTGKIHKLSELPTTLVRNEIAIDTALVVPVRADVGIVPFLVLLLFIALLLVGGYFAWKEIERMVHRPRKWTVMAKRAEDEAPVPCEVGYAGDVGRVRLGRDSYGEILSRGAVFQVARDWSVPEGESSLTLKEGAAIRLTRGIGGEVELIFTAPGGAPGAVGSRSAKPEQKSAPRPLPKKR